MKIFIQITLLTCLFFSIKAQENKHVTLVWENDITETSSNLESIKKPYFKKAFYQTENGFPFYVVSKITQQNVDDANITIIDTQYDKLTVSYPWLQYDKKIQKIIKKSGAETIIQFLIPAIRQNEIGISEKLISFDYSITIKTNSITQLRTPNFRSSTNSPLATGDWYKIGVTSTGIQKLNKSFFSDNGIPISSVNPKNIRIFGYSEGMLSEDATSGTPLSIPEIPIHFEGNNDGVFNTNEYLLFFTKAANVWEWDQTKKGYNHEKHLYTDTVFYYINIDTDEGKRIQLVNESSSPSTNSVTTYENHQFHELDKYNLIKTGKQWFGERFDLSNGLTQSFNFSFPNKVAGEKIRIKTRIAVRATTSYNNNFVIKANGTTIKTSANASKIGTSYTAEYAVDLNDTVSFDLASSNLNLSFTYSFPNSSATAWFDYVEVKTDCDLRLNSNQLFFSQPSTVGSGNISEFQISNTTSSSKVWDVTNPYNTQEVNCNLNSDVLSFKIETDSIKEFIVFNPSISKKPFYAGKIANQNLASYTDIDYILISLNDYLNETKELANFHKIHSKLSTKVVSLQEVYNEFSNGHADITAIRNFIQHLYKNASSSETRIKYLFLMGDGSYDPKNRVNKGLKYFPSFQSENSISPTRSFVSDDYFGMLNDAHDIYHKDASVDIGIGRFPARNLTDAKGFIKKVKHYASPQNNMAYNKLEGNDIKSTYGDWKNNILFVADDGSSSDGYTVAHMNQTEMIIDAYLDQDSSFNSRKVYFDAYNKESTAGGGRYPDVSEAIRITMNEGVFFVSYIGHGGEAGWADERVLSVSDINAWDNMDGMPVFVTATCEFSRYDDPERTSAGELVVLNPNGGAIGMITTTRLVYGGISNNIGFSINFFESVLNELNGEMPRLGDAIRLTKYLSPLGTNFNNRKFVLLGDPALKMAYPKYNVVTTKINDTDISNSPDTLKALDKIKISGEIRDDNDQLSIMDGFIYPVVYDKLNETSTLDNNETGNTVTFYNRNSIIYKGVATVNDGKFDFEFIVPKDIKYTFGSGRISYYFANDSVDGKGFSEDFTIGGSSSIATNDDINPVVELFMNDTNFIFGGLTDENPIIIANVSDDNGINTSGTSLGHDISAVLDEDFSNPIILNNYYSSTLNDYKRGKITYPLNELSDGQHSLSLKVWDVNNNSGKAYTEFIVSSNSKLAIDHIFNYPNPFTNYTEFYFEHNQIDQDLDVLIKIYTISGKLIKSIKTQINSLGNNKPNPIEWDGKDDFGDQIGRGVYIYQLEVQTPNGDSSKKLEKLVILR